ncbi:hypothetical protein ACWEFJ_32790 [Actinosynnema sp. NPDC004786]
MPTDFEPLVRHVQSEKGGWFGFLFAGGWHVSVFPTGPRGRRTFTEFHVTREQQTGNRHHFYTDDGHVQLNHLDNIVLTDVTAWAHANTLAAEFYQRVLNLHVTAEDLRQELTTFQRRTGRVRTMDEYRAAERLRAEQASTPVVQRTPVVTEEIDMFDFTDDEPVTTTAAPPPGAPPQGQLPGQGAPQGPPGALPQGPPPGPAHGLPPGPPGGLPPGPGAVRVPAPVVAPPVLAGPLPPTTLALHEVYQRHLRALVLPDDVRRRWSEAFDQLYSRLGRHTTVAELKVFYDQVFTSGLSM